MKNMKLFSFLIAFVLALFLINGVFAGIAQKSFLVKGDLAITSQLTSACAAGGSWSSGIEVISENEVVEIIIDFSNVLNKNNVFSFAPLPPVIPESLIVNSCSFNLYFMNHNESDPIYTKHNLNANAIKEGLKNGIRINASLNEDFGEELEFRVVIYERKQFKISDELLSTTVKFPNPAKQILFPTIGIDIDASGEQSTVIGNYSKAIGQYSTALGRSAEATGQESTALGHVAKALGSGSTALGVGSKALGNNSTALGALAEATNLSSIAIGQNSQATGQYSTAIGTDTSATGQYSTALGHVAKALGSGSTALGVGAQATGFRQIVIGTSQNYVHVPGSFTHGSTIRMKENIQPILLDDAIQKIMQINPVHFDLKEELREARHKKNTGFIAEELVNVMPEAVYGYDGEYAEGISTTEIIAYLTKVVQNQQQLIEQIQSEICFKNPSYSWCE